MPAFTVNNKNILFIHIPKTGGTSIEAWLSKHSSNGINFFSTEHLPFLKCVPQHLTYSELKVFLASFMSFDYIFTIVRNPYKRLESEYFYRTEKVIQKAIKRPDFSIWALRQLHFYQADKYHLDNHLRLQVDFLDKDVEVFRFEDGINNIIQHIAKKLDVSSPSTFPTKNTSKKEPIEWSSELLARFNSIYMNDIIQLGYPKEQYKIPPIQNLLKSSK